jgi:hypothetical protein
MADDAWRESGAPGSGMHWGFVLASAEKLEPVLVGELDDKTPAWRAGATHSRMSPWPRPACRFSA